MSELKTLSYNILVQPGEDGGYFAFVPSVRGVVSDGDTVEEAYRETLALLQFTLESMVECGEEIPESDLPGASVHLAKVDLES